jgi:tetratricopeptide (TPR) repeat protein
MGRPDLAEAQWREALRANPQFRLAWQGLGDVLLEHKRFTTLEIEAQRLDRYDSLRAERQLWRAKTHQRQEQEGDALCILEEACRQFPTDLELRESLSRLLFDSGAWHQASASLERLTELQPENAAAHHNLGIARMQTGDLVGAQEEFVRSLELRPSSAATQAALKLVEQS